LYGGSGDDNPKGNAGKSINAVWLGDALVPNGGGQGWMTHGDLVTTTIIGLGGRHEVAGLATTIRTVEC
jgi:hypothetical protein